MPESRTKVALRFTGDALNPRELTDSLRCEPTLAYRKGEPGLLSGVRRPWPTGIWSLEFLGSDESSFDAKIHSLFDRTSADLVAWTRLSEQYAGELFVGVFQRSVNEALSLSPSTARRIAERGLRVSLDLYYVGQTERQIAKGIVPG